MITAQIVEIDYEGELFTLLFLDDHMEVDFFISLSSFHEVMKSVN